MGGVLTPPNPPLGTPLRKMCMNGQIILQPNRQLFSETIKIVHMVLAVPASATSAERTFSFLRRLKTWLRRTMTQKRLTHLAVLHCHRQRAENVDIEQLREEFALTANERRATFRYKV